MHPRLNHVLTFDRYINFAHGDEQLQAIYGSALTRLKQLKKTWDPTGAFSQWFMIK